MAESTQQEIDPIAKRFGAAATGNPPTDRQRLTVRKLQEAVTELGYLIEFNTPAGRNKSLALTALEDVQMRANRAIFHD